MPDILVLYNSHHGAVREMAQCIARDIEQVDGVAARLRTGPRISALAEAVAPAVPDNGAPYCSRQDLEECIGLALGSLTRLGNMAAQSGGTPYGASHLAGTAGDRGVDATEKKLCIAPGRRLAQVAISQAPA